MMIKCYNDIEKLYEQPVNNKDGEFHCPVCGKKAKREATIVAHMEQMDCYSTQDIFRNTVFEEKAYKLAKHVSSTNVGLTIFRKMKSNYTMFMKFVLFCAKYEINEIVYYNFMSTGKFKNANALVRLSKGLNEDTLRQFYVWLQMNPNNIDSERFVEQNIDTIYDPQFFCRSVEKGKIALDYIVSNDPLLDFMARLEGGYEERISVMYDKMDEYLYGKSKFHGS